MLGLWSSFLFLTLTLWIWTTSEWSWVRGRRSWRPAVSWSDAGCFGSDEVRLEGHVGFLVFLIPFVSSYLWSSITSSLHKNYIECCLKNASLWSVRDPGERVLLAGSREGSMSRPWWRFLHKMKMVFTSLGPRELSTRTWYPREKMDGRQEVGVPAVYPREGGF